MTLRRLASFVFVAAAVCVLALATSAASAPPPAGKGPVRLNELQAIGTHNSYKRELSEAEQAAYDEIIATPDYDEFLAYSHASIPNQFGLQDVRGLELDLFPDPVGGLYAEPLVRKRLGLGPLPDPAGANPGSRSSTSSTSTTQRRACGWSSASSRWRAGRTQTRAMSR